MGVRRGQAVSGRGTTLRLLLCEEITARDSAGALLELELETA
jgi:hypothetical protein